MAQNIPDDQLPFLCFGRFHNPLCIADGCGDRFFKKDMGAGLHGGDRIFGMTVGIRAYGNEIRLWLEELVELDEAIRRNHCRTTDTFEESSGMAG